MRHLMTSATFVKDAVRRRMVGLEKVGTDSKRWAREKHESFLSGLGIYPAHEVTPLVYHVQKQEKLNVLNDITLVQAPEDDDVIAGIYCEAETYDETSARANYVFFIMLFWALVGVGRTAVDVARALWRSDVAVVVGSAASAVASTVRFTTINRHGPVWHAAGGSKYHNDPQCRSLKLSMGVKQKTECAICGDGLIASSSTRPSDWTM